MGTSYENIDLTEDVDEESYISNGQQTYSVLNSITVTETTLNTYEPSTKGWTDGELSDEYDYIHTMEKSVQTEFRKPLMLEQCTQTKSIAEILSESIKKNPEPMDISPTRKRNHPVIESKADQSLHKLNINSRPPKRKRRQYFIQRQKSIQKRNTLMSSSFSPLAIDSYSEEVYSLKTAPRLLIVKEDLSRFDSHEIIELRGILEDAVITQSNNFFTPKMSEGYVVIDQTACEIMCLTRSTIKWLLNVKLHTLHGVELKIIGVDDYPIVNISVDIVGVPRNLSDVKDIIFKQNRGHGLKFDSWFVTSFERYSHGVSISFKINQDDAKILRSFRKSYLSYGSRIVPFTFY